MLTSDESPSSMYLRVMITILCVAVLAHVLYRRATPTPVPISVNYHFTRKCNKECGFCFHTAKSSYQAPLEDAKRALALLKLAGMRKLNFAGGEPFLDHKFLGMAPSFGAPEWTCQLGSEARGKQYCG